MLQRRILARASVDRRPGLLGPPNHDRLLERHPHLRKSLKLLGRKVELRARATTRWIPSLAGFFVRRVGGGGPGLPAASAPEREERLVDLARNHFAIGDAGERILRGWLRKRPDRAYFTEGLHELLLLARAPDEGEFDVSELPGLLAYSEAIARTTAEAMDAPTAVTPAEEQALVEIASELRVDDGESWAALLRELEAPSARTA